jgi:prepilin-type N-terminal cleavage/methylation domain-containing protein
MRPRRLPARLQRGFTLIELVITLMIMGVLAAWGASMLSDNFRTVQILASAQTSADQARYALERLAREIREVKYVDKNTGYAISSTMSPAATSMAFTRTISGADVTVTVNKSGTNLTLAYSSPAVTSNVSASVNAFTLRFLDLTNTETTLATQVRFVEISLTVNDAISGQSIAQKTRVALRNT